MGKKKPVGNREQQPTEYILNHLAHLESVVANRAAQGGDPVLVNYARRTIEGMRKDVAATRAGLDACDADYVVNAAISLGQLLSLLGHLPAIVAYRSLKDGQRRGGKNRRIIDPAHVAELEAEANRLRILNPKWKPARISRAVAQWYGTKHKVEPPSEKTIKRELATFFAGKNGQC